MSSPRQGTRPLDLLDHLEDEPADRPGRLPDRGDERWVGECINIIVGMEINPSSSPPAQAGGAGPAPLDRGPWSRTSSIPFLFFEIEILCSTGPAGKPRGPSIND